MGQIWTVSQRKRARRRRRKLSHPDKKHYQDIGLLPRNGSKAEWSKADRQRIWKLLLTIGFGPWEKGVTLPCLKLHHRSEAELERVSFEMIRQCIIVQLRYSLPSIHAGLIYICPNNHILLEQTP